MCTKCVVGWGIISVALGVLLWRLMTSEEVPSG